MVDASRIARLLTGPPRESYSYSIGDFLQRVLVDDQSTGLSRFASSSPTTWLNFGILTTDRFKEAAKATTHSVGKGKILHDVCWAGSILSSPLPPEVDKTRVKPAQD